MLYTYYYHSPIGTLEIIEENEHITEVRLLVEKAEVTESVFQSPSTPLLQQAHHHSFDPRAGLPASRGGRGSGGERKRRQYRVHLR